jgi:hypothetical protein
MFSDTPPDSFWPAHIDDIWLRHILEGKALRANEPRVKATYIANKFEKVADRPWAAEVSGRLLSEANDIAEKAEREAANACNPGIKFRHVIYIDVRVVRLINGFDVYAEPRDDDSAHANCVIRKIEFAPSLNVTAGPKFAHEPFKKLADLLKACDAANLSVIESLRTDVLNKTA